MLEVLLYTLERFSISPILMPPQPVSLHNEISTHRYFHRLNICTSVYTQVNSSSDRIYLNMKILFLKSLVLTYWQPSSFVTGHPREFLRELSRINLFCIAISINNVKVIQIIIVTIVFYGSTRIRHSIKILNNFSCIQTSNFQDIYFLYIKLFHRALHFEN